jgi:hypothetical protein
MASGAGFSPWDFGSCKEQASTGWTAAEKPKRCHSERSEESLLVCSLVLYIEERFFASLRMTE